MDLGDKFYRLKNKPNVNVSDQIKRLREDRGLSQEELAEFSWDEAIGDFAVAEQRLFGLEGRDAPQVGESFWRAASDQL